MVSKYALPLLFIPPINYQTRTPKAPRTQFYNINKAARPLRPRPRRDWLLAERRPGAALSDCVAGPLEVGDGAGFAVPAGVPGPTAPDEAAAPGT